VKFVYLSNAVCGDQSERVRYKKRLNRSYTPIR